MPNLTATPLSLTYRQEKPAQVLTSANRWQFRHHQAEKYMILKTQNSGVLLLHLRFNMMEFLQTGQRIGWRLKVTCTMAIWQTTLTPNCTKILKRSTPALGYTNRETFLAGSI